MFQYYKGHIYSEDHVFYKMAEQEFSEIEDNILMEQFQQDGQWLESRDFLSNSRKLANKMGKMIGKLK